MQRDMDRDLPVEHLDRCPNCNSTNIDFWVTGRDRLLGVSKKAFEYSQCNDCGVMFQSLRPKANAIARFYPDDYGPYGEKGARRTRFAYLNKLALRLSDIVSGAPAFRSRMSEIYNRLGRGLVVLDFGCGAGKFLDQARKQGCETIGMDFSPIALSHIAGNGHRALAIAESDWDQIPDASVGFVRMNHVVEHLYDPNTIFGLIFQKMAPGAVLHVATPNCDSFAARRYREHWFSLDCPRHIIIFSPESLRSSIAKSGFSAVEVIHEPISKDLVRSKLYEDVDAGRKPQSEVASAYADGFLNLRFALAARSAVRHNQSDRIHLLARKPGHGS